MDNRFFNRNAEVVAKELLGKIIVRKVDDKELRAKIVETEAYFDENDPASRARQNGDLRETMLMEAGRVLVYGVHNNWLVNFVTDGEGIASAVLIRAIEPLNFEGRGNGPGLLCESLRIDKKFHKNRLGEEIWVEEVGENVEIVSRFRIGVKEDLDRPLRFYIKDNKWVSRK